LDASGRRSSHNDLGTDIVEGDIPREMQKEVALWRGQFDMETVAETDDERSD